MPALCSQSWAHITAAPSRCATSTASLCPRWPTCWAGPFTPPKLCSCGRATRSARLTRKGGPMTSDPFEILHEPIAPVAPPHAFTVELKRRVADQLGITPPTKKVFEVREYTPARLHSITPYLSCLDPAAAIDWYQTVFDAVLLGHPILMDDGSVRHAQL